MKYNLVGMPSKVVYVFSEYWECFGVFLEKKERFLMIFHCCKHAHTQKKVKKVIFRFFDFFAISTPSNEVGHGCHAKPSLCT